MNKKPRPAPDTLAGHWGLFGGMFDPVHNGHVTIAEDLRAAAHLNGVLLVPGVHPPHRHDHPRASFEHRRNMLTLAFENVQDTVISDIETRVPAPGYTFYVVRALKREHPDTRFSVLIGADQLEKFSGWYRPDDLLREADIIAGTRPGYSAKSDRPSGENVRYFITRPVEVSSTQVRDAVQNGWSAEQLATLVPATVAQYIIDNRLYQ